MKNEQNGEKKVEERTDYGRCEGRSMCIGISTIPYSTKVRNIGGGAMKWCYWCESLIEPIEVIEKEPHTELREGGYTPYEEIASCKCPICGEEDYLEEPKECELCGNLIDPREEYCTDCKTSMDNLLSRTIATFREWHKGLSYMDAISILSERMEENVW